MIIRSILFSSLLLAVSACATTAPREACTSEWIDHEVNAVFSELRQDVGGELKELRALSDKMNADGSTKASPLIAFQLLGAAKTIEEIVMVFTADAQPRLEELSDTCDRPDLMVDALGGFLRDEGAPETVVEFLEGFSEILEDTETTNEAE